MPSLISELAALWRARALAWTLARREIAARHAGSVGGVVWAYAQPILMIAAYYLVFDVVFAMRLGEHAPTRAVGAFLIVGALPWMAFCDAISRGMNSLIDAGGVLQKNPLPPILFPARAVLASVVIYMPLMALIALAYGPLHGFSPALASIALLLVLQAILCLLAGYLLAILAAALRDTVQVIGFLLSVGIFVSPVLFPSNMFPAAWRWVLWLNPMTPLVEAYQAVLLQGAWPSSLAWATCVGWVLLLAVLLDLVVRRSRDQLVDWL